MNRTTLREWKPERYLANGWFGSDGGLNGDATGWWATAAAEQLLAGQVSPTELETTFAAFMQLRQYYKVVEPLDSEALATESLQLVEGILGQANNPALVSWIEPCIKSVKDLNDLNAFLTHFRSVVLQYAVIVQNAAV